MLPMPARKVKWMGEQFDKKKSSSPQSLKMARVRRTFLHFLMMFRRILTQIVKPVLHPCMSNLPPCNRDYELGYDYCDYKHNRCENNSWDSNDSSSNSDYAGNLKSAARKLLVLQYNSALEKTLMERMQPLLLLLLKLWLEKIISQITSLEVFVIQRVVKGENSLSTGPTWTNSRGNAPALCPSHLCP